MLVLRVRAIFLRVLTFLGVSLAQRPTNTSTCDYYAQSLYGANNNNTQFQLMQSIIALAFGGPSGLSNVSSDLTGIFFPGTFQNVAVDLRPWFNGTLASSNLNNQPAHINWLDDGGTDPLRLYLTGQTSSVVLHNGTNEYQLFQNWFVAFAHIFACSMPPHPPPSTGAIPSLAYVHKYMNLNYTDLGYFINQLSKAAIHFGFSEQDGETFSNQMNALYNVRCAPPVSLSPAQPPQLLSLCQADSCPLAVPSPDCADYVNLTANGISSGSPTQASTSLPSSSTTSISSTSATSSTATPSQTQTAAASTALSSGAIAGIAVGGAAGGALLLGAAYFLFRCGRRSISIEQPVAPYVPEGVYGGPKDHHASYTSYGGTVVGVESPRFGNSPAGGFSTNQRNPVEIGINEQHDRYQNQYQDQYREHWNRVGPDTITQGRQ